MDILLVLQNLNQTINDILLIDAALHDKVTKEINQRYMQKRIFNKIRQKHSCYL